MTSTVAPSPTNPAASDGRTCPTVVDVDVAVRYGITIVNVDPTPIVLSTWMSPPIIRANRRLIARPRPVPPNRLDIELSAWLKSRNSRSICSSEMPIPES